jgi:FixJ family two-component response regulator
LLLSLVPTNSESVADKPLIAIVDDDPATRVALSRLLRAHGFFPLTFTSGEAFLKTQPGNPAACVLLDLIMPGPSGFEVKEQLAKSDPHVPIILITANADPEVCLRAEREGFVGCLPKPCTESQLIPLITQSLRRASN